MACYAVKFIEPSDHVSSLMHMSMKIIRSYQSLVLQDGGMILEAKLAICKYFGIASDARVDGKYSQRGVEEDNTRKKGKSESQRELGAYFKFPPFERILCIRYLRFKLWSLQTSAGQSIRGKKGRRRKAKKYNGGSFQCVLTPDRSDQYSRQGDLKLHHTKQHIWTNKTEGYFHNVGLDLK